MLLEDFEEGEEVLYRAGYPVQSRTHNDIYSPGLDVAEKLHELLALDGYRAGDPLKLVNDRFLPLIAVGLVTVVKEPAQRLQLVCKAPFLI